MVLCKFQVFVAVCLVISFFWDIRYIVSVGNHILAFQGSVVASECQNVIDRRHSGTESSSWPYFA